MEVIATKKPIEELDIHCRRELNICPNKDCSIGGE